MELALVLDRVGPGGAAGTSAAKTASSRDSGPQPMQFCALYLNLYILLRTIGVNVE
jgi:hypothetical protein